MENQNWIIAAVYILPTFIAAARRHKNGAPIMIVNIMLGWTLVGWIVCFAWAFSAGGGSKKNDISARRINPEEYRGINKYDPLEDEKISAFVRKKSARKTGNVIELQKYHRGFYHDR
jgi:hypothetical protein